MTDAEYVFKQTSAERKRIGVGTFNKKRRGGKTIRFPSDNLTRKERAQLNGEPVTYRFKDPVAWKDFLGMPRDIQQEYLDLLIEKFPGVLSSLIAESLGTKDNLLSQYVCKHGLKINHPAGRKVRTKEFLESEAGIAWVKWNGTKNEPDEVEEPEALAPEALVDDEPEEKDNIDAVIAALTALKGTGAKVTIEVTL